MYAQAELVADQSFLVDVPRVIDEHCVSDMGNCKPVAIASFEKMVDPESGPKEVG